MASWPVRPLPKNMVGITAGGNFSRFHDNPDRSRPGGRGSMSPQRTGRAEYRVRGSDILVAIDNSSPRRVQRAGDGPHQRSLARPVRADNRHDRAFFDLEGDAVQRLRVAVEEIEAASLFLDKLIAEMPFPVRAIQVDGGSEFMAEFEQACAEKGIALYVLPPKSPELNGAVERCNGAWRYEFYACRDLSLTIPEIAKHVDAFQHVYNTYRPHRALAGLTPKRYLDKRRAEEALRCARFALHRPSWGRKRSSRFRHENRGASPGAGV